MKAIYIFFSIPTLAILIIIYLISPTEPRFKNANDCYWYAIDRASKQCTILRKGSDDAGYFNYDKCYNEHFTMYYKEAIAELKGDTSRPPSRLFFTIMICFVFGMFSVFYRLSKGDNRWWWFLPGKEFDDRPDYRYMGPD
jgi:hypothetical protein